MELESRRAELTRRGLGIAGISYDSQAVLKDFAARRNIGFPLLADPESRIIRAFGILNPTAAPGSLYEGMTIPGTFVVDASGRVVSKWFEDDYRERYTIGNFLLHNFGSADQAGEVAVRSPGVRLRTVSSNTSARPGQRVTFGVEIELAPGTHLYAPGAPREFMALEFKVAEDPLWKLHPLPPPPGRPVRFASLNLTAPVYEGRLSLLEDLTIAASARQPELAIPASLRIQACTAKECFPPETLALEWKLKLERLDSERVAPELRRK